MRRSSNLLLFLAVALLTGALACGGGSHHKGRGVQYVAPNVWTDATTGLMWQNGTDVGSVSYDWADAKNYCANLSWAGYSGWRLPTISELRGLIRGCKSTVTGGACPVTDSCASWSDCWNDTCDECLQWEGPGPLEDYWPPAVSGNIAWYWSSTVATDEVQMVWGVGFLEGLVDTGSEGFTYPTRCVR